MRDFAELLETFAKAVEGDDRPAFVALFHPEGVYEDALWGAHTGRQAIESLLARFHQTGRSFQWQFLDPVCDGDVGYARYCFSCIIRREEADYPVVFEGFSQFRFKDNLIINYEEMFDRGGLLTQLGMGAEALKREIDGAHAGRVAQGHCQAHVRRLAQQQV